MPIEAIAQGAKSREGIGLDRSQWQVQPLGHLTHSKSIVVAQADHFGLGTRQFVDQGIQDREGFRLARVLVHGRISLVQPCSERLRPPPHDHLAGRPLGDAPGHLPQPGFGVVQLAGPRKPRHPGLLNDVIRRGRIGDELQGQPPQPVVHGSNAYETSVRPAQSVVAMSLPHTFAGVPKRPAPMERST